MTDNRSSVMEVLERVRRHDLTPREAEQLWAEQGQDSPIATAPPGGLPPVVWPLSLAFTWIAWRSDDVLGREWERLRFWKVTLEDEPIADRQVMTIAAARRELAIALLAGKIVAKGIEAEGSARTPIETVEWPDLTFEPGDGLNVLTAGWLQPRWHDVRVSEEDVRRIWPAGTAPELPVKAQERSAEQSSKRGGGRPTVHDWAGAAGFAARDIIENDYPSSMEDLARKIETWFRQERGKAPAFRELQSFAAEVIRAGRES